MVFFLAIKYFKLSYIHCIFRQCYCICNRLQYIVNIAFICTGKPKIHVIHFTVIFALLQWSGIEPTVTLMCASMFIFIIIKEVSYGVMIAFIYLLSK